jgi:hypothetical protein
MGHKESSTALWRGVCKPSAVPESVSRAKMSTVRVQREFVMHLHRLGKLHLLSLLPDNRAQLGWLLASTNNFLKVWRKQLASSGLFIKEEETKGGDLTLDCKYGETKMPTVSLPTHEINARHRVPKSFRQQINENMSPAPTNRLFLRNPLQFSFQVLRFPMPNLRQFAADNQLST